MRFSSTRSIFIVVLFAVISVGGVLFWQKLWNEANPESFFFVGKSGLRPQSSAPPDSSEAPLVEDQTAGWQTYRNEKYGFEIKYPIGWRESRGSTQWFESEGSVESIVFSNALWTGFDNFPRIDISLLRKPITTVLQSPVFPNDTLAQRRNITFAGTAGVEITYKADLDANLRYIILPKGTDTFVIVVDKEGVPSEKVAEFELVLSTFRFLE